MVRRFAASIVALTCLTAVPSAFGAADPYPGQYEGGVWKGKLTLFVDADPYPTGPFRGVLEIRKRLKSKCGKIPGFDSGEIPKITNGKVSFHERFGEGPLKDTYTLKGEFKDGGRRFEGKLAHEFTDKTTNERCTARTRFDAALEQVDVLTPFWDAGHYTGSSPQVPDQPLAFDVTYDAAGKGGWLSGLRYDVGPMQCTDPNTGETATITSHISISGPIEPNGEFDISFPGAGTAATGRVRKGQATGALGYTASVDADGTPNPNGRFLCFPDGTPWANEAPTFTATNRG